jgi:protein-tyrosine phosphatase
LYRSDHFHNLKTHDHQKFSLMNLKNVIDFRSQAERERLPNRLPPDEALRITHIPVVDRENPNETVEMGDNLRRGDIDGINPRAYLLEYYGWYATTFTPEYRHFMQIVLDAQGQPLLFHCTAGKDRTGFAAAITLRLLGVEEGTILKDYMLTNVYTRRLRLWLLPMVALRRGFKVAQIVRNLMLTQPEYLATAFEALDAQYGSFENYVQEGLGLGPADINQLRDALLEDSP